ncbi:hypothetical protein QEN19_002537 [Hanseniaspora menglaensis]
MAISRVYRNNDKDTFGEYTFTHRWTIIINNILKDLPSDTDAEIVAEFKALGEELTKGVNVRKFTTEELEKEANLKLFNDYIEDVNLGKDPSIEWLSKSEGSPIGKEMTWSNGDWLFTEIYLYRRVNAIVLKYGLILDVFDKLKTDTFLSSYGGVLDLCDFYSKLDFSKINDEETKFTLYKEFISVSLWGNATDLSLLTNLDLSDLQDLQSKESRLSNESKILVDDTLDSWKYITEHEGETIDIVCDNAGFEVFCDILLAFFLIDFKIVKKVVLHLKDLPYMVSDVMKKDVFILSDILSKWGKDNKNILLIADKLKDFLESGQLELNDNEFWTYYHDYWHLSHVDKHAGDETFDILKEVLKSFEKSKMVIFKGDLNYRKLCGDRWWPKTTTWEVAVGRNIKVEDESALQGDDKSIYELQKFPMLSLRTCKADVMVGLKSEDQDKELTEEYKNMKKDQDLKDEWWSSSGKWAVVCFNKN